MKIGKRMQRTNLSQLRKDFCVSSTMFLSILNAYNADIHGVSPNMHV